MSTLAIEPEPAFLNHWVELPTLILIAFLHTGYDLHPELNIDRPLFNAADRPSRMTSITSTPIFGDWRSILR